jgi:hypothetical protein
VKVPPLLSAGVKVSIWSGSVAVWRGGDFLFPAHLPLVNVIRIPRLVFLMRRGHLGWVREVGVCV